MNLQTIQLSQCTQYLVYILRNSPDRLYYPVSSFSPVLCQGWRREEEKENVRTEEEEESRSMTKTYSGSASKWQQLRPSRQERGEEERREEESQTGREQRTEGQEGKLFPYYCRRLYSIHAVKPELYADCSHGWMKMMQTVFFTVCTRTNILKAPFTLIIPCVSYQIWLNTHSFTISQIYCVSDCPDPPKNAWRKGFWVICALNCLTSSLTTNQQHKRWRDRYQCDGYLTVQRCL